MATCSAKYGFFNLVTQPTTSIVGGNENAFFPTSNLKDSRTTRVYRSTTASDSVTFDFKTAESVDMFFIKPDFTNGFGFNGDITIEGNFVDNWSSAPFSTTMSVNRSENLGVLLLDTPQNYRFWRVTGTGTTFFELSNLFIGKSFEAGKNVSLNWNYIEHDLSTAKSNKDGQSFIDKYSDQKGIDFNIKLLTKDEMDDFRVNLNSVGKHTPIWIVMDYNEVFSQDKELFAGQFYITKTSKFTNAAFSYYNTSIVLKETK